MKDDLSPVGPTETTRSRIGIFFGSSTGATAAAADLIRQGFTHDYAVDVELLDVADFYLDEMMEYDYLIVGIPTWNIGQLQRDWEAVIEEFDQIDLTGKQAALFGLGDQIGYPDTFVDAMVFVADRLQSQGATLVGRWPATGYTFTGSWALREDGQFAGLVLDDDNQPELTPGRVQAWVDQLARTWSLPRLQQ